MAEKSGSDYALMTEEMGGSREGAIRFQTFRKLLSLVRRGEVLEVERFMYKNISVLFPEDDFMFSALRAMEYAATAVEQVYHNDVYSQSLNLLTEDLRRRLRKNQTVREVREQCIYTIKKTTQMVRSYMVLRDEMKGQFSPAVTACMDSIVSHMPERRSLTDLARDVHLSPKYLSAIFVRETGKTISSFEQELSVREASFLLKNTDYAYSEISYLLNFSSQSYFNAVFKKAIGMTPGEYRRMHKNKKDEL